MASRVRFPWRRSALLGMLAFTTAVGCAEPTLPAVPAKPPQTAPAPAPQVGNPVPGPVGPAPIAPPTYSTPSLMFLQSLVGAMLLREDQAPITLANYTSRQYQSSSLAGRGLLEAWEEPSGNGSRVVAMIFDPASGSAQTVPVESNGRRDFMPAVAGTTQGNALMVWASQSGDGMETLVMGQALSTAGASGPRWSYRRGTGQVLGMAVAPGKDGYVALWVDKRVGGGLGASSSANSPGQTQAMVMSHRITLGGEAVGTVQLISGTQGLPGRPALAWSGDTYLATWVDSRTAGNRLYGRILDNAGQSVSTEILIAEGPTIENPAVAWDGQRFQVTWADGRAGLAGARDYFVQAVGKTGSLDNSNVIVSAYRMTGPNPVSRVVPSGTGAIAVYSGQAVDPTNAGAAAPSSIFASLLVPGATPSVPFAIRGIEGVRLVDAQPWGNGMVVLSERAVAGQLSLEWSFYTGQVGSTSPFGSGLPGRPYYRDPFSLNRPL